MSKLERRPPLGRGISTKAYSSELVTLRQQAFFGVAKLIAGNPEMVRTPGIEGLFGFAFPEEPNTFAHGDDIDIAWAAPHHWLLLGDEMRIKQYCAEAKSLLVDKSLLVIELTHARAVFQISGAGARDVLSSLCPLDLHPRAFATGRCAHSILGETGVFVQQCNDLPIIRVMVDQTHAAYAWRLLSEACRFSSSNCSGG